MFSAARSGYDPPPAILLAVACRRRDYPFRFGGSSMSTALEASPTREDDYRARFYRQYRSTHVGPRKGEATAKAHAKRFSKWDRLLGPYLPASKDAPVADLGC